jgi:hypothetical protein
MGHNIKENVIPNVMPLHRFIQLSGLPKRQVMDRVICGFAADDNGNGVWKVGRRWYVDVESFSRWVRASFHYCAQDSELDSRTAATVKIAAAERLGMEPNGDWLEEAETKSRRRDPRFSEMVVECHVKKGWDAEKIAEILEERPHTIRKILKSHALTQEVRSAPKPNVDQVTDLMESLKAVAS